MRLKWLENDGSDPEATKFYESMARRKPQAGAPRLDPPGIMKAFSLRPDVGYHIFRAIALGHFDTTGHLAQDTKQMIATYTSALRSCVY